jgi:2,3-diaminopropionate biosynthesis protein SbnB
VNEFHVVPGTAIAEILAGSRQRVMELVREAYLLHEQGATVNPDSYFLRFPDRPGDRVIALPAYLGGAVDRIGIKWIASFPNNLTAGLPRASAVLVLNDSGTGYPIACLEAAQISAARTGASAALAARALVPDDRPRRVAFVGTGVVARSILDYLTAAAFPTAEVVCFDLTAERASAFVTHTTARVPVPVRQATSISQALECDVVVFATTAGTPHVSADTPLHPDQLLLNISLRDLAPQLLLAADNVVDDVEHCLKAETSPHLAERLSGGRDFITGTLGGVLTGDVKVSGERPTVFSPFGLGVLDLAVGSFVLAEARQRGTAIPIAGFFAA